MTKSVLSLLFLLALSPVSMAATTSIPIPKDRVESHKLAVVIAMRQLNFECSATGVALNQYEIEGLVMSAVTAEKVINGNQQMIVFRSSTKALSQHLVYVKTSDDQKTIVSMQAQTYTESSRYLNSGTLTNPNINATITLEPTGVSLCLKK
jgi:hypothetical protein